MNTKNPIIMKFKNSWGESSKVTGGFLFEHEGETWYVARARSRDKYTIATISHYGTGMRFGDLEKDKGDRGVVVSREEITVRSSRLISARLKKTSRTMKEILGKNEILNTVEKGPSL